MIWDGVTGPTDLPAPGPRSTFSPRPFVLNWHRAQLALLFPNWPRVKLALLKSIPTGTFIDVQFYAYNTISNSLPLDPKPLFTSSIVIEEWAPAITTRK